MTDQLREALDDVDQGRDYLVPHDIEAAYGSWATVVDAARKWLAVTESEPIQWCETHNAHALHYCWRAAFVDPVPDDAKKRCRIVSKQLVAVSDD